MLYVIKIILKLLMKIIMNGKLVNGEVSLILNIVQNLVCVVINGISLIIFL